MPRRTRTAARHAYFTFARNGYDFRKSMSRKWSALREHGCNSATDMVQIIVGHDDDRNTKLPVRICFCLVFVLPSRNERCSVVKCSLTGRGRHRRARRSDRRRMALAAPPIYIKKVFRVARYLREFPGYLVYMRSWKFHGTGGRSLAIREKVNGGRTINIAPSLHGDGAMRFRTIDDR
ncbi:hypothetical protein EVAR_19720_1 [Eumeta japonica]|uniref:Uncharacterized protein n=1 Tax=Eumeta variegata TaxID=151549 RepID=A0A4C1UQT1_EUMVA|nr:hypothetical protein EVAR_19720_1 [Eumeta japonica]